MPGRFFLTTPIYYVNDAPHLGTAYSTVNADALVRWHRLIGDDSWFLTGTDEHGLKNARAAEQQGFTPQEWVDQTSRRYLDAWAALDISNDDFIRTTEPRHHLSVQRFMQAIYDNGYMHKGVYEGWYCVSCEAYYPESDLLDGRLCPMHERPVEWLTEENWFFELSRFEQPLLEWYESNPDAIFPDSRRNEALGIIKGGLQDISITRTSIDWGVRVPWDEAHVFYVWYDALVNYITAIGYGEDTNASRSGGRPCTTCSARTSSGSTASGGPRCASQQASTRRRTSSSTDGCSWVARRCRRRGSTRSTQSSSPPTSASTRSATTSCARWRSVPTETSPTRASSRGTTRISRTISAICSRESRRSSGPSAAGSGRRRGRPGRRSAERGRGGGGRERAGTRGHVMRPQDALEATWRLVRAANAELEAVEPWKLPPGPEVDAALGDALEALRIVAVLVSPVMPRAAAEIWARIGLAGRPDEPGAAGEDGSLTWGGYPGGVHVVKGEALFPRRTVES